jgi:hypothetical protein
VSRDARKPIIPLSVEEDEEHVQLHADGTWRASPRIIFSEHDVGRIRAGYACCRCWEIQDNAFPDKCWVCGYPMKDRQAEYVAKAYKGNVYLGPSSSLEDELAAMDELDKRKEREATVSAPQIIVPGMWR